MTIREAIKHIAEKLQAIYDEAEATNISEWVIEHLTGIRRTNRIAQKEKELTEVEVSQLQTYLQRLLNHEPVQYVLQESWFCGLKFYVDKNVLIPRPETEELVEWIISDCKFPVKDLRILDVGTGSGCIAISLKRKLRKADVWGCDISSEALAVAGKNADGLGIDINLTELDFLKAGQRGELGKFDIIVSNPPYIPLRDKAQLRPNVVQFEPYMALFVPNNNPLIFYEALAVFGKKHLNTGGSIYAEINEDLGETATQLFTSYGYSTTSKKDLQEKERMIRALHL